jgi:hypothetical protein
MIDEDDCGAIGGMNDWQRKRKCSGRTRPSTARNWLVPISNPVTNRVSYGTAAFHTLMPMYPSKFHYRTWHHNEDTQCRENVKPHIITCSLNDAVKSIYALHWTVSWMQTNELERTWFYSRHEPGNHLRGLGQLRGTLNKISVILRLKTRTSWIWRDVTTWTDCFL